MRTLLDQVVDAIPRSAPDGVLRVAVDGSGKTVFAAELAQVLRARGRWVVRASVDDFHQVREARYCRGKVSGRLPADSYDYERFQAELLDPFGAGSGRLFRRAILLVDGIFLHRDELVGNWDFSIFLTVGFEVSAPRMVVRDVGSADVEDECNQRYVGGQRLYPAGCAPSSRADLVVDNNDLANPVLV